MYISNSLPVQHFSKLHRLSLIISISPCPVFSPPCNGLLQLRAPVTDTNPNADGANPGSKTYNHNFLTKRISVELARDGQSSTQFRHEGENKSHWFMPLTYDGSAEVEQHGPRNQAK